MAKHIFPILALVTAVGTSGANAFAQSTAKPKPPIKPAAKPAEPAKGMTQMAGDNGQLGVTYTIGTDAPLNFTLNSAAFKVERIVVDDNVTAPTADEKLLVLNYTIHNPNKDIRNYNWNTLGFTAVSPDSKNYEYAQIAARAGTSEGLNIDLKPAQKIDVYTAIVVPAKGLFPKLIVTPTSGGAVLRYDLRGKVKALPAPIADPADTTGSTARAEVPAVVGTFYPGQALDLKFSGGSYTAGPIGEQEKEEGKRFFVVNLTLRNPTPVVQSYDWSSFKPVLVDSDGETVEWSQTLLKAKRDDAAGGEFKPGEEYTARLFFQLPENISAKTLTIGERESRTYSFDVSAIK
ncbi:MAG TPA: DUF4352 domain-containing protein [Abditibacteriaceae bacterium]